MSDTPQSKQAVPAAHPTDAATATGDSGRRWYHPRPEPRCRADLAGFNYSYWLFIVLLAVVLLLPW
jgi:hypothetical protein